MALNGVVNINSHAILGLRSLNRPTSMLLSLRHKYSQLTHLLMLLSVMAFALGSVAHAGHEHSKERAQHQTCDYCVGYAHLVGSPSYSVYAPSRLFTDEAPVSFSEAFIPLRDRLVAQPRAPPAL